MNEQILFYLQIAFWVLLLLVVHCYVLFPITLPFVSEIFKRKGGKVGNGENLPTVSILISAYNEEAVIERKIQNLLELDYPMETGNPYWRRWLRRQDCRNRRTIQGPGHHPCQGPQERGQGGHAKSSA